MAMVSKSVSKIFIIFCAIFVVLTFLVAMTPIKADQAGSNITIQMHLVPSGVESGISTYSLGYVSIVDNTGSPIVADQDIQIKLESSNPVVASVPADITIHKKDNYANFNVTTANDGYTIISAKLNDQIVSQKLTVGAGPINYLPNTQLVLNLSSNSTDVNSNMVFSVYLQFNNTIIPAPNDIHVSFQYDNTLARLDQDEVVIKKGDYYALDTITTLSKTGNAYLKATSDHPSLSSAATITISSTRPANLKLYIMPTIMGYTETHFDTFVGLYDSSGHPAVASHDVQLRFTANDTLLNDQINQQAQSSSSSYTIKKGNFGLYDRFQYTFVNTKNYTISVSAQDLGPSSSTLSHGQSIPTDSPFAANPSVYVTIVPQMPPNSTSIMVYQIKTSAHNLNKGETLLAVTAQYPSTSDKPFSTESQFDTLQLYSSDSQVVNPETPAYILPGYSYGTAIISSGQKSGTANLYASLKGIGSGGNSTSVFSTKDIISTMIFSPGGHYLVFDKKGVSDIYFVLLDRSNRPQVLKNGIQFLVKPINNILSIPPVQSYADIEIQPTQIDTSQNTATISAAPVGANVNTGLGSTSVFSLTKPMGSLKLNLGIDNLSTIASGDNSIGVVQIFDIYGNPDPVTDDRVVNLASNSTDVVVPSAVIIPKGSSFTQFPIMTPYKHVNAMISASAPYYRESDKLMTVQPYTPSLNLDAQYQNTPIAAGEASTVNVMITDEFGDHVPQVKLKFTPGINSTVTPHNVLTNTNGLATVSFSSTYGPKSFLDIDASKDGYIENSTQIAFDITGEVSPSTVPTKTTSFILGLPGWILYVIIAGILAAVGVIAFTFLRKPKVVEEEEGETEI